MKEKKKSPLVYFILPGAIVVVIVLVYLAGWPPHQGPAENGAGNAEGQTQETGNEETPPLEEPTQVGNFFIEDIAGPHDGIEGNSADSCRGCHGYPYEDWQPSPHAQAMMSTAFQASLTDYVSREGRDGAKSCFGCHAPHDITLDGFSEVGVIDSGSVAVQGINCFACHSKKYRLGKFAHGESAGYIAYQPNEPEFCANCHDPEHALLEIVAPSLVRRFSIQGPVGNPYQEWKNSPFSVEGENFTSCLECHGQNGSGTLHRWPESIVELVRSAYMVEKLPFELNGSEIASGIKITNSGAGHKFPTGDPGKVVTFTVQVISRQGGDPVSTVLAEKVFKVGISLDEQGNYVDNRMAPGESITFDIAMNNSGVSLDSLDIIWSVIYGSDPVTMEYLSGLGIRSEPMQIE